MFDKRLKATVAVVAMAAMLGGCGDAQEREVKYLQRAERLLGQGELAKARVELKNALRINPKSAEGWYRMALVEEAEGNLRNAFAALNRAVEQDPRHAEALVKIGSYYFMGEAADEALKRADTVLLHQPGHPGAHALKGAVLLRGGNGTAAMAEAQAALAADKTNVGAISVLAGLYSARNDTASALQVLDEAIRNDAHAISLFLLKARIHESRNETEEVVATYRRIIDLKPAAKEHRAWIADFLIKANRKDDAETLLREGVAAAPDDLGMKMLLVSFLNQTGGLDRAEAAIREWIATDGDNERYYFALAELYMAHGAAERAVKLLQEVVDTRSQEPPGLNARVSLAQINYSRGERALAEQLLGVVLEKDAQNVDALYVRSAIALDKGSLQGAIADSRIILRNSPRHKAAMRVLAEALLRQGDTALAADTLAQAVDVDPVDPALQTRMAQIQHLRGDTPQALERLKLITQVAPEFAVAWETLARIRMDRGDWAGAENAIAALEKLPEQTVLAEFLRGRIQDGQTHGDQAAAAYRRVIEAAPQHPLAGHATQALLDLHRRHGTLTEAVRYIERLLAESRASANAHELLGETYLTLKHRDAAARHLDAAIEAGPSATPFVLRTQMLMEDGRLDDALALAKRGVAGEPSDVRLRLILASALEKSGDYMAAITVYEDFLSQHPDNAVAANNMAALIADFRHTDATALDRARQTAERFVASADPLFLDTLGWVYFRQGKLQQAATYLERAVAGGNTHPQLHYHLGAVLAATNQAARAKEELAKAVAGNTDYPGLGDARALLGKL